MDFLAGFLSVSRKPPLAALEGAKLLLHARLSAQIYNNYLYLYTTASAVTWNESCLIAFLRGRY
jgi:hypothetical protein